MNMIKRFLSLLYWPVRKVFNVIRWSLEKVLAAITLIATIPKMLWRGLMATPSMLWVAMRTIWRFVLALPRLALALPRNLWAGLLAIPRLTWRGIRRLVRWVLTPPMLMWQGIVAVARMIGRSPRKTYQSVRRGRDWMLAKIEYLQSESAKWKMLFNVMKSPFSLLRTMGFSPQMAATMLFGATAVGGGVVVNEVVFAEKSFSRGDPGVYNAPLDVPVFYEESFNTLRLDLGSTSVGLVEITDVSLNSYTGSALPSGETNVIHVGGMPTVADPAFAETFLEVGTLEADRWRCETLTISNSQVNKLIIKSMVSDGQSIAPVAGTPRDRGINGGNRADDMKTQSGYYDMLKVTAASTGQNGFIDHLRISNVYSRSGGCLIDRVKAGTMIISYGVIGGDSSLTTKAFTVNTSVIFKSFENEGNVEVVMAVPAIVDMTQ
jgi:hypothetical protein